MKVTVAILSLLISQLVAADALGDLLQSNGRRPGDVSSSGAGQGQARAEGRGFANRSARFRSCEELLDKHWGDILANQNYYDDPAIGTKLFAELVNRPPFQEDVWIVNESDEQAKAAVRSALVGVIDRIAVCQAYFVSTDSGNYTGQGLSEFEGDGNEAASSSFGASGLECANQPTQEAQQQCAMQAQAQGGGNLSCSHNGPETHDFKQCKRVLKFLDGFVVGKQVMQVQQTYRAGSKQLDLQEDLNKKARSEEGIGMADGMKAQAESVQQQGNLAYEQAAFDAAKAGTLMAMLNSYPRPSSMIEQCQSSLSQGTLQNIINGVAANIQATSGAGGLAPEQPQAATQETGEPVPGDDSGEGGTGGNKLMKITEILLSPEFANEMAANGGGLESYCVAAISTNPQAGGQNFLFMNQEVVDKLKETAMKAGLEALANGVKGALLHNQAGMIEDAIKDIEEFEPPEFPVAEEVPATASECLVDPEAEGCIAPTAAEFEGFRNGGFNASIGGSANLGTATQDADLDDSDGSVTGATNRSLIPENFGVVDSTSTSGNDFIDGEARAGSIKTGQAAAGGGGGVGGGGGGAGFGGGSARKPAGEQKPSGKRDVNIKTSGTGLAAIGGRGAIGTRKKKTSNPFSKLLGKNKAKGNGTLNFRGPAQVGGKKGSIFQMISNRYNSVSKKDRLLKYESTKN